MATVVMALTALSTSVSRLVVVPKGILLLSRFQINFPNSGRPMGASEDFNTLSFGSSWSPRKIDGEELLEEGVEVSERTEGGLRILSNSIGEGSGMLRMGLRHIDGGDNDAGDGGALRGTRGSVVCAKGAQEKRGLGELSINVSKSQTEVGGRVGRIGNSIT
jgi:hypothetical protein